MNRRLCPISEKATLQAHCISIIASLVSGSNNYTQASIIQIDSVYVLCSQGSTHVGVLQGYPPASQQGGNPPQGYPQQGYQSQEMKR